MARSTVKSFASNRGRAIASDRMKSERFDRVFDRVMVWLVDLATGSTVDSPFQSCQLGPFRDSRPIALKDPQ